MAWLPPLDDEDSLTGAQTSPSGFLLVREGRIFLRLLSAEKKRPEAEGIHFVKSQLLL
jgi:hypothetical protein